MPTPTTSRARAQRRPRCTSRRASTSTSPPAPEASGAPSSTRRWTVPTCWRTSPRSAARRWSGPATSSASARTGSASAPPGGPGGPRSRPPPGAAEGDPKPPLPEGCFALVPLEEAAAPLVRLIRGFKPHVMTTYDERGGYPHPDHVKCHEISVAAFEAAADPERYPELGEPWQVLKLYYHHSFNKARIQAIHDAMIAH